MTRFHRTTHAIAGLAIVLCMAASQPAAAQPAPHPLYFDRNIPQAKRGRLSLPFASDVILTDQSGAAPAASVNDANARFAARGAEAIRYTTDHRNDLLKVPNDPQNPPDLIGKQTGHYNEMNAGFTLLAMMAYKDYFFDETNFNGDAYRNEVYKLLANEHPGIVGTSPDTDVGPLHLHWHGEYDVLLQSYLALYYKYFDVLPESIREKLVNELFSVKGPHPGLNNGIYAFLGAPLGVVVPETENHELMIETARYLTNQLLFEREMASAAAAHRAPDRQFDNNRNGNGRDKRPLVDYILLKLQDVLKHDFIEYNARDYQNYTMVALLNLESYAYDDRVRLAARMALDYVSAKVAVSSNRLLRSPPFRRRNEVGHYGPVENSSGHSYLSKDLTTTDPQTSFYSMLAGNTEIWNGHASGAYAMVHAALRDYRVPDTVLDLFVNPAHRRFYQRLHHSARTVGGDTGEFEDEVYAGSPGYLISGGGNPTYFAYVTTLPVGKNPGDDPDRGVAVPTTFIPSSLAYFGTAAPPSIVNLIQAGQVGTDITATRNVGVAPDFLCGDVIYMPEFFHAGTGWNFVDFGSNGFYLATFGVGSAGGSGPGKVSSPSFLLGGFVEAFDISLHPGVTFEAFKSAVLVRNGKTAFHYPGDNTYVTFAGQRITFRIKPGSGEILSTADAQESAKFAFGTVLNSDQESAIIRISNPAPALGTITLDMHDQAANGDPLFGLHHPRRTSETGVVETGGSNEEVWVNFSYTGVGPTQGGDFGDPFKTLTAARDHVALGGTINIMPGSANEPILIKTPMTLRSFPTSATIGLR